MAWKEKEIERRYFKIHEVAERLGVRASCLRYWLNEFGIDVKRRKAQDDGERLFTQADLRKLRQINHLLRVDQFTIPGAKRQLEKMQADKLDFAEMENALNAIP
jgi:DNA-binding transcriptional MerR regulator